MFWDFIDKLLLFLIWAVARIGRPVFAHILLWFLLLGSQINPELETYIPPKEIRKTVPENMVFFGEQAGFFIGKPNGMQGNIFFVGGTGKGKSQSIVLNTEATWSGLMFAICTDRDQINAALEQGKKCRIIDPFDENTPGIDPFYFLKFGQDPSVEANILASSIIPFEASSSENPMWTQNARLILQGAFLHFFNEGYTFLETINEIQDCKNIMDLMDKVGNSIVPEARKGIMALITAGSKSVGGMFTSIISNTQGFVTNDPAISLLSRDDVVTPRDLELHLHIYFYCPLASIETLSPSVSAFLNQFLHALKLREKGLEQQVLIMIDELPAFHKIPEVVKDSATFRKLGVFFCLVAQNFAQLVKKYGAEDVETIIENFDFIGILKIKSTKWQNIMADMIGKRKVIKKQKSITYSDEEKTKVQSVSITEIETEEYIVKPDVLGKLKHILLLWEGTSTYVNKWFYFKHKANYR